MEKRLKMENLKFPKTINDEQSTTKNDQNTNKNDDIFTFEYIQESKELIFPIYCSKSIGYPTKHEISDFNKFLLNKYSKEENL